MAELRLTSRKLSSPRRAEKRLRLVEKAPDVLRRHEGVFAARGRVVVGLNAASKKGNHDWTGEKATLATGHLLATACRLIINRL